MRSKKYGLTPAHRAQLDPWRDRWIANAMSTAPMTETDREAMRSAVRGLYAAANLPPPPAERIVFVPSPFVCRFAGGFASALWRLRSNHQSAATSDATSAATWDATWDATSAATRGATRDATWDATDWFTGLCDMRALASAINPQHAPFLLSCTSSASHMWDGGNQWSGWPAFLSFFRHVACLPLDYSKWQHYEAAALHAGPRVMHAQFCIISDRPIRLLVDAEHRPHCDDGPFCAWADGTALWAWHGTRVPAWIIAHPERLTPRRILDEPNAEIRRVMFAQYGEERFIRDLGALPMHSDAYGDLYRVDVPGDEPLVMVRVVNSTPEADGSAKGYWLRVDPSLTEARAAVAWTFGLKAHEYAPSVET